MKINNQQDLNNAEDNFSLGVFKVNNGHIHQGRQQFLNALKKNPKFDEAYVQLGNICLHEKKEGQAQQYYIKAVEANDYCFNANNNLGFLFHKNPQTWDIALFYLQKAIKCSPNRSQPYYLLGKINFNKKQFEVALKYFEESIKIDGKNYNGYHYIGLIHINSSKKLQKAQASLRKCIQLAPDFIIGYIDLAKLYFDQERFDQGEQVLKKFNLMFPDNLHGLHQLGKYYQSTSKLQQAKKTFKNIIEKHPNSARSISRLGQIYLMEKKLRRAEEKFNRALEINNNLVRTKYKLAILYREQRRYNDAQVLLNFCVEREPLNRVYILQKYKNLIITLYISRKYDRNKHCKRRNKKNRTKLLDTISEQICQDDSLEA